MPKVIYHDSDGVDKTLQLGSEPVLIGRASECQIQTHDAMVSRKHARITWDGGYWVEDLGSSNGVFLGPDKVQRAPFRPGDVITCGSLVLRMVPETRRQPDSIVQAAAPRGATPYGGAPIHDPPPRGGRPESRHDGRPGPRHEGPRHEGPAHGGPAHGGRPEPRAEARGGEASAEWEENVRTSANPALAGGGPEAQKVKAELLREVARREKAESALLVAEEKVAQSETAARELIQLRRRVEQLQTELNQAREAAQPAAPAFDAAEVGEASAVFNDALAELKASLRAAVDEAELLTAPVQSVRVVRESMRSAMDELERARQRLREMTQKLGLR